MAISIRWLFFSLLLFEKIARCGDKLPYGNFDAISWEKKKVFLNC